MRKLKVLIADDSVVYRTQIKAALNDLPYIEIVGVASNGRIALEKIKQSPIDLLILDLEMPEMDGIQTLKELSELKVICKVLVFSSMSKRGAEITLEALRLGASDFIPKPGATDLYDDVNNVSIEPFKKIRSLIEPKIVALFSDLSFDFSPNKKFPSVILQHFSPDVILIGSSTGGPTVLEKIFSNLTGTLRCPIFITQHMPPLFTATLAERIHKLSGIPTYEAKQGQKVENAIYLAPGNFHMTLSGSKENCVVLLNQGPLVHSVRPAVDPLFSSAISVFKDKCLGFILTGMGADGRDGSMELKQAGGAVVIQSESTCVVFGMPGSVKSVGAYDRAASPEEIIDLLKEKALRDTRINQAV